MPGGGFFCILILPEKQELLALLFRGNRNGTSNSSEGFLSNPKIEIRNGK